jgi:diguanylate cyclase (GGDEF)-like protein/PAS domain S-box-containing protein
MGFTVMQHAFAGGAYHQGLFSDMERQAMALAGSGDTVWDWDVTRDRVVTSPDLSPQLGLSPGALAGPARNWLPRIHADDRDRFRTTLDVLLEHRKGRLNHQFRMRAEDGHYHWMALRARPVLGSNGEVIRCVGTIIDVTEQKTSEDRLLHDAVHDNLTGLPNRQLFVDRLQTMIHLAERNPDVRPSVFMIDLDRFKQVNDRLGMSVGDTILLALTRRLKRLLKPHDTLARISGDQFGLVLVSEQDAVKVAALAEAISKAISAPIDFAGQDIRLTASIGLGHLGGKRRPTRGPDQGRRTCHVSGQTLWRRPDRTVPAGLPHRRLGQAAAGERPAAGAGAQGTDAGLPTDRRIEGRRNRRFRSLLRWEDPKRGTVPPSEFIPVAEASDLILELGMYSLKRAADDLALWQETVGEVPVFMSVNLSSAQLLKSDLCNDVIKAISASRCDPSRFRLELTETLGYAQSAAGVDDACRGCRRQASD